MDSVVNLYKPSGISSHQAVTEVKRILKTRKAGHAGTLDPLAEGVLLVCIGEATKISRFLCDCDKEYVATIKLGEKTDTFDAEGKIIETKDTSQICISKIDKIMVRFVGKVQQMPPMYSAIKTKGIPLYKFARKGQEIRREPREVNISEISVLQFNNPFLKLMVKCSKGTYIRSLADDIGNELQTGAHLFNLVRTRIGKFDVRHSARICDEDIKQKLISIDDALAEMKEIILKKEASNRIKNGIRILYAEENVLNADIPVNPLKSSFYRLKDDSGNLFAIGKIESGFVKIERMILTKPKEVY